VSSDVFECLCQFNQAFDMDFAVGPQLDIIGQWIGIDRELPFQPSGGVSPILDDTTYRLLLRAKMAQNNWNGQIGSLYTIWHQLFPTGTIAFQDNQNMTATIFLTGSFSSVIQDMIVNGLIVPRPETVQYTYIFATTLPVFGFDRNDTFVAGFDEGHFA
jgi:hypothetical protein